MTIAEIIDKYASEKHKELKMVYVLSNDGELCLTKGGDLFGMRTFHLQAPPLISKDNREPPCTVRFYDSDDLWDQQDVYFADKEPAYMIRKLMIESIINIEKIRNKQYNA